MWSDDQVRLKLHEMLIEVLAVDDDELKPDARFFEDLGGESIDLLELSFLSEKKFGRRVEFQRMVATDELEFDQDRRLTEASIVRVGESLPFLDLDDVRRESDLDSLRHLLTIENLFQYLKRAV